jgi:hypothetical protein
MTEGLASPVGEPGWAAELGGPLGDALRIGIRAGVGRVTLRGSTVPPDEFLKNIERAAAGPLLDLAREGSVNPEGLGLLSEVTATAVAVRVAHGEPALTEEEVRNFLPQLVTFLNTFFSGCDPT